MKWLQIKYKDRLSVWAGNKWELSTLSINKKLASRLVITYIYTHMDKTNTRVDSMSQAYNIIWQTKGSKLPTYTKQTGNVYLYN